MKLQFTKMHGIGNDFVVLDLVNQDYKPNQQDMQFLADRHFGIGCDQILIVEKALDPKNDFAYRIFNADGGEVEQCGNGARCFATFVYDKKLTTKKHITVETTAGIIELIIENDGVRVNMGKPIFSPNDIPFIAEKQSTFYEIDVHDTCYTIGAVSMGNPHAVLRVENTSTADVATLGPIIENHPRFPKRVNVGFMQVVDAHHIILRVFERGSGETLACGTGACAAVVHGINAGWLESPVRVKLPGGELIIEWQNKDSPVNMIGPTCHVFDGTLHLKRP